MLTIVGVWGEYAALFLLFLFILGNGGVGNTGYMVAD